MRCSLVSNSTVRCWNLLLDSNSSFFEVSSSDWKFFEMFSVNRRDLLSSLIYYLRVGICFKSSVFSSFNRRATDYFLALSSEALMHFSSSRVRTLICSSLMASMDECFARLLLRVLSYCYFWMNWASNNLIFSLFKFFSWVVSAWALLATSKLVLALFRDASKVYFSFLMFSSWWEVSERVLAIASMVLFFSRRCSSCYLTVDSKLRISSWWLLNLAVPF
jgi:hypothetical protein